MKHLKRGLYVLIYIEVIILFVMTGCEGGNSSNDDFITVDVNKSYSSKKELIIQDFMDVEYIALETNDNFVNQGFVQAIDKKFILVKNWNDDGDIFVYTRAGKALRKINRKGQSGEEYSFIMGITLDEEKNEMYVNSHMEKKILVYDLYGNFKRSFKHMGGSEDFFYTDIFDYDREHLICNDEYGKELGFVLISKQDGSVTKKINIPFKEKILLLQKTEDKENNSTICMQPGYYSTIVPHNGNWVLSEFSSDTVYSFSPDQSLRPFLIRTPSVQSENTPKALIIRLLSNRYYFMETIKNEWDFSQNVGFQRTFLMYDNQERNFFKYIVYNGDYTDKNEIYMNSFRIANSKNELWCPLDAPQLVKAYNKGKLKGKLKEIAATLNEESNSVIMLIKHKEIAGEHLLLHK